MGRARASAGRKPRIAGDKERPRGKLPANVAKVLRKGSKSKTQKMLARAKRLERDRLRKAKERAAKKEPSSKE